MLLLLGAFLFLGMVLAGARFVQLQVIEGPRLRELAESQRLRRIETPAQRGAIFDRMGRKLAQSIQVYTVIVDPHNIELFHSEYVEAQQAREARVTKSLEQLHQELADYYAQKLEVCPEETLPQFSRTAPSGRLSRYSIIARQIAPEMRAVISEDAAYGREDSPEERLFKQSLRHTVWELDYMRVYPLGEV
ncbi:MAG: hypothetical protein FWF11_04270, partial [Coriobacteriia bacterium]|nr:hypothetical protein [Coriobacteriia bacterium]